MSIIVCASLWRFGNVRAAHHMASCECIKLIRSSVCSILIDPSGPVDLEAAIIVDEGKRSHDIQVIFTGHNFIGESAKHVLQHSSRSEHALNTKHGRNTLRSETKHCCFIPCHKRNNEKQRVSRFASCFLILV